MDDPFALQRAAVIRQNRAGVVISLSGVDDHRQRQLDGKRQLLIERFNLCVSVSVVVVVIESDFANGHDARVCCAGFDPLCQRGAPALGLVRMNALGTPNGPVPVGDVTHLIQVIG